MNITNALSFGAIIVDLFIISILLSSTIIGYKKGLIAVAFKILCFIVSIIIVFILYKPVSNWVINNTTIDEKLADVIYSSLMRINLSSR